MGGKRTIAGTKHKTTRHRKESSTRAGGKEQHQNAWPKRKVNPEKKINNIDDRRKTTDWWRTTISLLKSHSTERAKFWKTGNIKDSR